MKDGFYQIQLSKKSSELCTFSTPLGYYHYLRCPQGIKSAPEIFMKENMKCFQGINDVIIYFDDILIASDSVENHLITLHKIFERALNLNLKFNKDKFQFMKPQIKYLGHMFNSEGCRPDPDRVGAVQALKPPTNRKELQSVLGLFNYMRDFIPNMSDLISPLRILLKKDVVWHWTNAQQDALDKLKNVVSTAPVLKNFDSNLPVVIQCDSSQLAVGSCLLQNGQPIAFASHSLSESEQKYPQIEKELLSIVYSCRKFHNYIWGNKVLIQTDHLPLVSIFKKNISNIVSDRIAKRRLGFL
jgi:Reverse transcriptase (RNA-dependent DNA polymerase).